MAGQHEADLCYAIVQERFGTTVSQILAVLLREPSHLSNIIGSLKGRLTSKNIPLTVMRSLALLEQFNIVKFKIDSKGKIIYSADVESILALLKAPRCGMIIQSLYGAIGPATDIFLFILNNGRLTCSEAVKKVMEKLTSEGKPEDAQNVTDLFRKLVEAQFLIKCPQVENTAHGCPIFQSPKDPRELFALPDKISIENTDSVEDKSTSRKRKHPEDTPKADIYWRINFSRFDRYFRDELIENMLVPLKAAGDDKSASNCRKTIQALFKHHESRSGNFFSASCITISAYDILKTAKDQKYGIEIADIVWALRFFEEDRRKLVRKVCDSGGGQYELDFERAIRHSCQLHLECLIREQFNNEAVRIFRLLLAKGYLEEGQIEKFAMMKDSDTREKLFSLQEEGYVFTKPIGKTQDFVSTRTFFLYYVDLTKTVRGLLEDTCKALRNIILRRKKEGDDHKYLIYKNSKLNDIIQSIEDAEDKDEELKEEEIAAEKETWMPPVDMAKYEQFLEMRAKLDKAEVETERVLMTYRLYLQLSKNWTGNTVQLY